MIHQLTGQWSVWTLAGDVVATVAVFAAVSYALVKWLMSEPLFRKKPDGSAQKD
jgi:hypothetical protein